MPFLLVTCTHIIDTHNSSKPEVQETINEGTTEETRDSTEEKLREGLRLYLVENEIWIDEPYAREAGIRFFEELAGSQEIAHIILEGAARYDVPAPLAFALVWAESSFDPHAVNLNSTSIDRGLFQLNSRSFPELDNADFFDPHINADHGLRYLEKCLEYGENEVVGLAMYNAGRRRVNESRTPKMTLDYIAKVLDYRDRIEEKVKIYVAHTENRHVKANTPNTPAYVVDRKGRTK